VSETGRALRQALVLGALAVLIAAAVHAPLVKRFARGEFRETFFQAAEYPGVRLITLEEAEDLWRTGGTAAILDARAEELFKRGHIPGARNVPPVEAGRTLAADLLGDARDKALVVYCEGGDCQSSLALAKRLHDQGFGDIRVMTGGWSAWQAAGLPEEKTEKDDGQE
jgi:rhodanese-related sulfurtransferase